VSCQNWSLSSEIDKKKDHLRHGGKLSQPTRDTCRYSLWWHVSLGELAATVQVVIFFNFTRRWSFLTIHSWRCSFLPILLVSGSFWQFTHGGGPFCQKFAYGCMYSTIYLVRANQSNVWLIRASQVAWRKTDANIDSVHPFASSCGHEIDLCATTDRLCLGAHSDPTIFTIFFHW
jgi:hypothetical protein